MAKSVPCPTCGKPVPWEPASRWRPFCSERCRFLDLGDWLDERHRIPADDGEDWSDDGSGDGNPANDAGPLH